MCIPSRFFGGVLWGVAGVVIDDHRLALIGDNDRVENADKSIKIYRRLPK